jgi:hypothetical protein
MTRFLLVEPRHASVKTEAPVRPGRLSIRQSSRDDHGDRRRNAILQAGRARSEDEQRLNLVFCLL